MYLITTPECLEHLAASSCTGLFDMLHTGIALLSGKGEFLYCNRAFLDMFDLSGNIGGKRVSDVFTSAEQGIMAVIRTRKTTVFSSVTKNNVQGVSFGYPLLNDKGRLLGVVVESISASISKDKLLPLLSAIRQKEHKAGSVERGSQKKQGMLHTFESIKGESEVMRAMKKRGRRFASSPDPLLVCGESGTGKELVAQAVHCASRRCAGPFVTVNCAALPGELMESELFGYESGAFTGAKRGGMRGKFETSHGGTIFLDEIGELPLSVQAKLLRVLESGEVQKLGHHGRLHADFRLIAATNRNLLQLVREGTFREDLYHRLNILELTIPPLRERAGDIPLLTRYFLEQALGETRARNIRPSNELCRLFSLYPWPGNIRELKNVLMFALYASEGDGDTLTVRHLPERFLKELSLARPASGHSPEQGGERNLVRASARAERQTIAAVLKRTEYNKTLAARILGISRNKLYKKLRELDLHSPPHGL